MSEQNLRRAALALSVAAFALAFGVLVNNHANASHLEREMRNAGYSNVHHDGRLTIRIKATVHGCTIGFDRKHATGDSRVINNHEIYPYNISLVSSSGTWTPINLGNSTPTPDELSAYLGQHREIYPCYKP